MRLFRNMILLKLLLLGQVSIPKSTCLLIGRILTSPPLPKIHTSFSREYWPNLSVRILIMNYIFQVIKVMGVFAELFAGAVAQLGYW